MLQRTLFGRVSGSRMMSSGIDKIKTIGVIGAGVRAIASKFLNLLFVAHIDFLALDHSKWALALLLLAPKMLA
jgi:hypothetical protein